MRHQTRRHFASRADRQGQGGGACRAFTLIELLVVVAVISVLASLLMPAGLRAMRQASATQCKSNLAQLHRALSVYATTYDQSLPPYAYYYKDDPEDDYERPYKRPYWTETISEFIYPDMPRDERLDKAVRCPRYTRKTTGVARGYAANYGDVIRYCRRKPGHGGVVNSAGSMKMIEIENASKVLLLMDGSTVHCYSRRIWDFRFDRDEDGLLDSYHETGLKYSGAAPLRHDGALAAVFVDGHTDLLSLREWATDLELWDPY